MDTDSAMTSNGGIPSLDELKAFESSKELFNALDYAEMDVHQQLIQLEAAIEKVGGHNEKEETNEAGEEVVDVGETGEPSSDPIAVEEDTEASDVMDKDTPSEMDTGKEPASESDAPVDDSDRIIADEEEEVKQDSTAPATLFPDIIKNANFFITMALLQISEGRIIDAEQTILRSTAFSFLEQFTAPVAKVVGDLVKDNFESAYDDLKSITEKNDSPTIAWAAEQAFVGVQKLAHQMLMDCYKVVRVDAVKNLLHLEDLGQLQEEWEEFEQDGVSYLKRRDNREHGSGYQLQLKELVAITQQLQQKGIYDEVKQ